MLPTQRADAGLSSERPNWTSVLCCPTCNGRLEVGAHWLSCASTDCAVRYPIVRGIPVLLDESRSFFRAEDFTRQGGTSLPRPGQLKRLGLRWLPSIEGNYTGRDCLTRFRRLVLEQSKRPLVLNIGGKHASSFSALLTSDPNVQCIELDVSFRQRTNLIADPLALPFKDGSLDAVLLDAVLEHSVDPFAVIKEVWRVLKPDGLVYADTPFMIQVHAGAFDFMRFSHLGHRRLFRQFDEVESGVSCGPGSALAFSIQYFLLSFARSNPGRLAIKGLCRLTLFWLKYFDRYLVDKPGALDGALGLYFVGRKSSNTLDDRALLAQYRGTVPNMYVLGA
jgi:uncharacterized protein YbaR (Trm112 family)